MWLEVAWTWLQENQGPLVALGTAALAVTTLIYVILTGRLAASAERSAASGERLVQLEVLPVLWSRPGSRSSSSRGTSVVFEFRNVGKGAALNVSARIELADGVIHQEVVSPILSPRTEKKSVVEMSRQAMEKVDSATIWVRYNDALGNGYRSRIVPDGHRAELYQRVGDDWLEVAMLQPEKRRRLRRK